MNLFPFLKVTKTAVHSPTRFFSSVFTARLANSFMYYIQHRFICHPSDSTVSEDADRTQDCCNISSGSKAL
jgi:hypothetical protein